MVVAFAGRYLVNLWLRAVRYYELVSRDLLSDIETVAYCEVGTIDRVRLPNKLNNRICALFSRMASSNWGIAGPLNLV